MHCNCVYFKVIPVSRSERSRSGIMRSHRMVLERGTGTSGEGALYSVGGRSKLDLVN